MDKLFVLFGVEILKQLPGRVSTEVDARYWCCLYHTMLITGERVIYERQIVNRLKVIILTAIIVQQPQLLCCHFFVTNF